MYIIESLIIISYTIFFVGHVRGYPYTSRVWETDSTFNF